MDFAPFDKRGHPVVSAPAGYAEWARDYEATVATGLDRPLLEALTSIDWEAIATAADLACGTGRTGSWLQKQGVQLIDGDASLSQISRHVSQFATVPRIEPSGRIAGSGRWLAAKNSQR
jgi:hypothetical protein